MVVIDLAELLVHALLAAAHALGAHWRGVMDGVDAVELVHRARSTGARSHLGAHEPVGHVQVMDVLLIDMVTTEPGEEVPVLHLIVQLVLAFLAVAEPDAVAVPVHLAAGDVADHAILHCLEGGAVAVLIATLKAASDLEALFVGDLRHFMHLAHAWGVHGHGLFHEDVLAGVDGGFEVVGTEAGRRGEDHQVHIAVGEDLLVRIEAGVLLVLWHVHLVGVSIAQVGEGLVEVLLVQVSHGHEADARMGGAEGLTARTRAATAAADHADLDFVGAGGPGGLFNGQRTGGSCCNGTGTDEVPAAHWLRGGGGLVWCVHE